MQKITIYINPACSTCRKTLALFEDKDVEVTQIEYLKTPTSPQELRGILKKLGKNALEITRMKELPRLGMTLDPDQDPDKWVEILCANPILIERPIAVSSEDAKLGRPPETVLELLK